MDLLLVKTICIISLFFLTVLCGLLPIKVSQLSSANGKNGALALALLHCLSGGVFLGTFLLHLLPESVMLTHQVLPEDIKYPVSETIAAVGMILMLLLEQLLFIISNKQEKKIRRSSGFPLPPTSRDVDVRSSQLNVLGDVTGKDDATGGNDDVTTYGSLEEHDMNALTESEGHRKLERTRVIILVTALSVHSLFEGLAMGLQNTRPAVWTLFVAIATHKSVIAFSTGLQIIKSYSTSSVRPVIISICVFAVMSPLGASIGTIIINVIHKHSTRGMDVVNAVLQSVAAGTFMYITFFEILVKNVTSGGSHGNNDNSVARLFAVIVGFSIMAGLAVLH